MKNIFLIGILSFNALFSRTNVVSKEYYARSYVVLDYNSGKIMEGYEYNLVRSVASISKIMTAIVAIENSDLDKYVIVDDNIKNAYGSSVYLQVGEVITMRDLLYGLMLRSGNDASISIAIGVSENVETFVSLMNKKAQEIGMKDTIFSNPSGLDVDSVGNLSTSYDMALLMRYALSNDSFRKITSTKEYRSASHGVWINKNKLIRQYKYASGGKTGFTAKARRTLVTSAKKDDMEFIVVTLDCGNDFEMHENTYERYFSEYRGFLLLNKGSNYYDDYEFYCDNSIGVTVRKEDVKDYSVLYEIFTDTVEINLVKDNKKTNVGLCKSKKADAKRKKKSWLRRIFKS